MIKIPQEICLLPGRTAGSQIILILALANSSSLVIFFFRTSPGPVLPGPGAVSLQRRQHDGLPSAEHRQPGGGLGGGALGHGAAAGPRQGGERHDGGHDDGEWGP